MPPDRRSIADTTSRVIHAHGNRLASEHEIVLVVTAVSLYLAGTMFSAPGCGVGWQAAGWFWRPPRCGYRGGGPATGGSVLADPLAWYGRWLSLAVGAVLVLMTMRPLAAGQQRWSPSAPLLLAITGVMLVAEAGETSCCWWSPWN